MKWTKKLLSVFAQCRRTAVILIVYFSIPVFLHAQSIKEIKGTVKDSVGQVLEGVSIVAKKSRSGASTNAEGQYNIKVRNNDVLIFSFLGYQSLEIPVDNQATINIQLKTAVSDMDQVVVVGYSTQKKATITGSIVTVDGNVLKRSPSTSGRVACEFSTDCSPCCWPTARHDA
ncbi:MAG: carboxypeptidase-like regulatory domain-containing protein [Flavitalea sp.]